MRHFFRIALRVLILAAVFLASTLTAMRFAIHGRVVAVPKLESMTAGDAECSTQANGLLIEVENRFFSPTVPEGRIISQLPAPGEKVRRGTRVRVALSLGQQKIVIPSVVGQSQRAAEINIARRGLELGASRDGRRACRHRCRPPTDGFASLPARSRLRPHARARVRE
jgi:beta-lactam-binding protein with PASTA domain